MGLEEALRTQRKLNKLASNSLLHRRKPRLTCWRPNTKPVAAVGTETGFQRKAALSLRLPSRLLLTNGFLAHPYLAELQACVAPGMEMLLAGLGLRLAVPGWPWLLGGSLFVCISSQLPARPSATQDSAMGLGTLTRLTCGGGSWPRLLLASSRQCLNKQHPCCV